MHNHKYDYLVVGTGFFGATFAWHAVQAGKRVLVIDSRDHIGGNSFTTKMDGIDIHIYGPHIFHTSDDEVWAFITRFSKFNSYVHRVYAKNGEQTYSMPVNLRTLTQVFDNVKTPDDALRVLEHERKLFVNRDPHNFEEFALSQIGPKLYELLVKHYTEKQWGISPRDLPSSILKRLPVRFTDDDRYFPDKHQGIPTDGYTRIFEGLLKGTDLQLKTDFLADRRCLASLADRVLYTGSVDELYDYTHGELAYRTSNLTLKRFNQLMVQGSSIVNYTGNDVPYTRVIEHKFFTPERLNDLNNVTWCSTEASTQWRPGMVRCYPINDHENSNRYAQYRTMMDKERNMIFGGRLADYKYADMHVVIKDAMNLARHEGLI